MLTLGTGVGGGLILGGRPYRGSIGAGAELGHVVHRPRRRPSAPAAATGTSSRTCPGRRPTSSPARRSARRPTPTGSSGSRTRATPTALELLTEIGRKLGSGLGSIVNAYDPELIVVGGGFAAAGELLLAPAREVMEREALKPIREGMRVVRAELGTSAGMIGAALVALDAADPPGLMPLAVCATPIGNLQRRHAPRSRRARRGRSRPLRGHAADADPPRPPRPLRAPRQLSRAQRGRPHGRGAPAARGGMPGSRSSATPACPGSATPGRG